VRPLYGGVREGGVAAAAASESEDEVAASEEKETMWTVLCGAWGM